MINHGIQRSVMRPQDIEVTSDSVFLATDITPYSQEIEGRAIEGYEYNYIQYSKDEYIIKLHQDVIDTQMALCDLYESLEGDLDE